MKFIENRPYFSGAYFFAVLPAFVFTYFIAIRTNGPDYGGYLYYYENADSIYIYLYSLIFNFEIKREYLEITFFFLLSASKSLGLSFNEFLFFVASVQLYLLFRISQYVERPAAFILSYTLLLMFFLNGWYIRQGLGVLFGLLAWVKFKNSEKKAFLYLFLSVTSHASLFIFPILIAVHKFLSRLVKIAILAAGLIFYTTNYSFRGILEAFGGIYSLYLDADYSSSKIGILFTLTILLYFSFLVSNKLSSKIKYDSISMAVLFCFVFIILYGNGIPLLGRLAEIAFLIGVIFLFQDIPFSQKPLERYFANVAYAGFCLAYIYKVFFLDEFNFEQIQLLF